MKGIFRSAQDQRRIKIRRLIAMLLGAGFCASALPALAEKNPLRDVFFGETHIHTSWSFDAFVFGNTLAGPEEAYQYAMGKAIRHPGGYMVQMKRPLDFEAVTDHAEYMGTVPLANDPTSVPDFNASQLEGAYYYAETAADVSAAFQALQNQIVRLSK